MFIILVLTNYLSSFSTGRKPHISIFRATLFKQEKRILYVMDDSVLTKKDIEKLVTLLLKIEEDYDEKLDKKPLKEIVKVNALRKELNELVQQWTSKAGAGSFTKLFYELLNTAVRNGIGVPIDLIMLSKSIVTIDAVAKELDPEFRLEEWEGPLVEKIVLNKLKPKKIKSQLENTAYIFENIIKKFPESTEKILKNIETGKFGLDINTTQLLGYETLLDKTSRIKTQGTLIAGILIASALLYQVEDQPIIFGWPLAKIGLYTGLILAILLLVKNIFKKGEDNYE